jgi:predicted DNA-binding transcriptional regulator AlpA
MTTDVLLKLPEAATMLGISARTFRRMVVRGDIPVVRLSSKILRYRESDIAAIIRGDFSRQLVVSRRPHVAQTGNVGPNGNEQKQRLGHKRTRLTT